MNELRKGGLAAALTASNLAVAVELVYADSVAYVPSANTLGLLDVVSVGDLTTSPLSPVAPSLFVASSSNLCSDAKIGISPNTFLISCRAI